jgi:D-glycero-D-manno-heptose 1,7-bisphosphate phosphatase
MPPPAGAIPVPLPTPAVFLDRDDTLNENAALPPEAFPGTPGDLYLPEFVRLIKGSAEACKRLKDNGFRIVIITNQGGVARGHATLRDIEATNDRVRELIDAEAGAAGVIDAAYSAPHHPDAVTLAYRAPDHPWRKPAPGMILAAARELRLDLTRSWMVGDKTRDVEAGIHAGLPPEQCLRVGPRSKGADFADLARAAEHILSVRTAASGARTPHAPVRTNDTTTVTLRAPSGRPLTEPKTRATVAAAARAIAERTGVPLADLRLDDTSVTATLGTHRLAALGFMAELRRATNRWYAAKNPGDLLWPTGQVDTPDDDDDQIWPGDWLDGDDDFGGGGDAGGPGA